MDSTKRPSSYLDKRFDRLRDQDYSSLNQQNKSSRALKKLQSNRLAVIGIIFSLTIILSSIFAPLITKYDPQKVDLRSMLKPPSSEHILGTDKIGRDVFARIIYGGRISILEQHLHSGKSLAEALIDAELTTRDGLLQIMAEFLKYLWPFLKLFWFFYWSLFLGKV